MEPENEVARCGSDLTVGCCSETRERTERAICAWHGPFRGVTKAAERQDYFERRHVGRIVTD
jgi:hypothetical protein